MSDRIPLYYTFGNHMHWVDMEWLWGYHVLPGSIRDMLRFCAETGAKGNVNFDGVGYERLAAEDPGALAELRAAVQAGTVEVVGASYGQPYGALHGGESNLRQRIYGVRAATRLLGVRPRTFWEEEFDFFPQLPQMLQSAGFDGAALFYQWTWHTPEVPQEDVPVIQWEGHDGTRLRAATRNRLNLHQWPEDVDALLEGVGRAPLGDGKTPPLILQWLELMPSPDWMCRSEVLLPKTKELLADPRFDFRFATLGEYLQNAAAELPVRRYTPDQVFHGMSLGKNGDGFRRLSRQAEGTLLSAETFAAVAGLFGRPYAQWDVYPTWELEEAWRELLQAQHHDNDECEGLCGHVGKFSYERSLSLSGHVLHRTHRLLADRIATPSGSLIVFNPLGWTVDAVVSHPETEAPVIVEGIPSMGWRVVPADEVRELRPEWVLQPEGAVGRLGGMEVTLDASGHLSQIRTGEFPNGILSESAPLFQFTCVHAGERVAFELESMEIDPVTSDLVVRFYHPKQGGIRADIRLVPELGAVDIALAAGSLPRPDGGMNAGVQTSFALGAGISRLVTDSPYAVHEVEATGTFRKKYPTGDWMTSEQWFEEIVRPFDALNFVDLVGPEGGASLLVVHDGSPQWFRDGEGVRNLLTMYDPWDETYWIDRFQACYRLIPHRGMTAAERWRVAQSFLRPATALVKSGAEGELPTTFSAVSSEAPGAVVTAFYRETLEAGRDLGTYAARDFGGDYPYVLRIVELDGTEGKSGLHVAATVAHAARTNAMGERTGAATEQALDLRPHEIATVMLDLVEGRKQVRDLDAKREVWATVHRTKEKL